MHKALPATTMVVVLLALTGFMLSRPQYDTQLAPEVVSLSARTFAYRPAGNFWSARRPVDPPLRQQYLEPRFDVMKYQVSQSDYARCVTEGACLALDNNPSPRDDLPITGVSLLDAQFYAQWLSRRTGQAWRVPSDAEWAFFAGSRWSDDALRIDDDGSNPARRWLARYRFEANSQSGPQAQAQVRGSHGMNEFGIADLAGNVWEWTQTCQQRAELDASGNEHARSESCSIRIAEGRHRAAINDFVRDARGGGCSAGQPPDNLGMRLIRDIL
ncbi:MAG: hypothetical protein GAK43_01162 [Stenotrophomonas maltophilia]|nr:MAG: hypothetical protein GAK43_01162 [Stenotrophomonas maltophilia]